MKKTIIALSIGALISTFSLSWASPYFSSSTSMGHLHLPLSSNDLTDDVVIDHVNISKVMSSAIANGLKPKVIKAALNAYVWAYDHHKLGRNKHILTVVDFSLPSYKKRMWVLDLRRDKVVMNIYTTQAANSGAVYARRFSNRVNSKESSLGLYVTDGVFYGGHGKSVHLIGLQKGFNSNARRRNVEIHPAYYASASFVKAHHRAGRSWGCFGVSPSKRDKLIQYVRGGSALFAYAPQITKSKIVKNGPIV